MKTLRLLIYALVVTTACGGETEDGTPGPNDSAAVDSEAETATIDAAADATSEAAVDAKPGACNTLENRAPVVQPTNRPEDPPAPKGGVVSDGVYELASSTTYTGAGGLSGPRGETVQTTIVLSGATMQVVQKLGDAKNTHGSGILTFAGIKPSMTYSCPADFVAPWDGYDADSSSLTLHNTKIGLVMRLNKR